MGEFSGWFDNMADNWSGGLSARIASMSLVPAKWKTCPFCSADFIDNESLHRHILEKHREMQHYVCVNNIVVHDYFFCKSLDSITVRLVGNEACLVLINDGLREIEIESDTPILEYLPNIRHSSRIQITFKYLHKSFETVIYQKNLPIFNESKLENIITNLQRDMDTKGKTDWKELSRIIEHSGFNEIEKRYLHGIFEYYLAYSISGNESTSHYEAAYQLLRPFQTTTRMASVAIAVVCLKFNWINSMLDSTPNADNVLHYIARYITQDLKNSDKQFQKNSQGGILIDDGELEFINAVVNILASRFEVAREILDRLQSNMAKYDINFRDRIHLVAARYLRIASSSDRSSIEEQYDKIKSPYFQREVEEYKRG